MFVRVRHEISCEDSSRRDEEQDIVYRTIPDLTIAAASEAGAAIRLAARDSSDEVLLFVFGAQFNGYRLHYDRPFATGIQATGSRVHGPLIATLFAELVRRNLPEVTIASFRSGDQGALRHGPFFVCGLPGSDGRTVTLWARDAEGALAWRRLRRWRLELKMEIPIGVSDWFRTDVDQPAIHLHFDLQSTI